MDAKLTLRLNKKVIERAKKYAASQNRSLSRLIESYLQSLAENIEPGKATEFIISPFVKSMSAGVNIPGDLDYKKEFGEYVEKKHK